jgi:Xaa-Pro aminopeptidase
MKYHQIDRDLFIKKIYGSNEAQKCCRFNSNDIYPIGADSTMPFEQSRDIFLLKAIRKKLLLFPDLMTKRNIISKETNDHIAVWEGEN